MTIEEDAITMLRGEFIKQPKLEIFFTTETSKKPFITPLIKMGYLSSKKYSSLDPHRGTHFYYITEKAKKELRDDPSKHENREVGCEGGQGDTLRQPISYNTGRESDGSTREVQETLDELSKPPGPCEGCS